MDWLIQMGKDLGYTVEKLQDFVMQQQDYERGERIAERELERDQLAAQEKDRDIELARIAAEEAMADEERELERDRIAAEEAKADKERELEMDRIGRKKLRQTRIWSLKGIESRQKKRRLRQMKD